MAYHVIKTVKGKRYLYSQRSYREDGKVKTISQYIGAIDGDGVITTAEEAITSIANNTTDQIKYTVKPKKRPEPVKPTTTKETLKLSRQKPIFKLSPIIPISQTALENEHRRTTNKLKRYDISPDKFPIITVKHGSETKHYKPAFSDGLTVTTPKVKEGRETLRKEYRKALHRGFIETLEREAPEKITPFKYAFDRAYQNTQDALSRYLWNCNSQESFARVLALKLFSVMNPVPTGKRQKLPPHKLGLINYGKRDGWKTDYCELMAEIDKKGIDALYSQASREIAQANRTLLKTIKTKTLFFIRRRKTIKRLQARIYANRALLRKLDLIKQFGLRETYET